MKDLKELVIWNCDWNASSIGVDSWCLTDTHRNQNTLKKLVLKQCALDTKDVVNFEEIVKTFPNLEELQVDHFEKARSYYYFQTEDLEEDLATLSQLRNLRIIKFTNLYEMGNCDSQTDHGKGNSLKCIDNKTIKSKDFEGCPQIAGFFIHNFLQKMFIKVLIKKIC